MHRGLSRAEAAGTTEIDMVTGVPLRRELPGFEFVFDIGKAERLFGRRPRHSWRDGGV
jgi:hypothetical protein